MASLLFHGMNFKFFRKSHAMTLAEVVCATGIMSFVLVTMIGTLTIGLESLQKSTGYNQANIIAQRTIEKYNTMEYSNIINSFSTLDGLYVKVTVTNGTYVGSDPVPYKHVVVEVTNREIKDDISGTTYKSFTSIKKSAYVKMETIFIEKL